MYDAIVIGAGFAGLTAARDLSDEGKRVLVLEARDRIGGRTFYDKLEGLDQKVEKGGTWFVPAVQPSIAREIDRYQLPLTTSPTPENVSWFFGNALQQGGQPFPEEEIGALERAVVLAIIDAKRITFGDPLEAQGLEDLDVPFTAWLDKHEITGYVREIFTSYGAALCFGAGPDAVSALHVISWVAGCGNSAWGLFTAPSTKFAKGTASLYNAMAEELEIRTSSPVTQVDQSGDTVRVTIAGGEVVEGRTGVVAIPLNTWKDVEFSPSLSESKQSFTAEELAGQAVKIWVQVRNAPTYFASLGWNTPLQWLSTEFENDEGSIQCGFAISATELDVTSRESVERAVHAYIPEAEVVNWWSEDYIGSPYSRGTWTAFRPGQITRLAADSRAPEGRLAFATADVAIGFSGWIDGAIESGSAAAKQVLTTLGAEATV